MSTVKKRGKGYSTRVSVPPDPKTGRRRQVRVTARTKKELDDRVTELKVRVHSGVFAEADASKITVADYLTQWLATLGQSVRPVTQARYSDLVRLHVSPLIGRIRLAKLTALDLQNLYTDRMTLGKLSSTTCSNLHIVIHRALKQAVRWGLLSHNVADMVTAPRKGTPRNSHWTKEQAEAFLAIADQHEWAALWRLALLTGLRRGEALGLKWDDIDFDRKALVVRHTLSRGPKGVQELGEPKSSMGRRSVAMSAALVTVLREHWRKQFDWQLEVGPAYRNEGWVFAMPDGRPIHPTTLGRRFQELVARAGVPRIRFHDLRHTHATFLMVQGVNPRVVQQRLGHSDVALTLNRYSHASLDLQQTAADQLDGFLELHPRPLDAR